MSERSIDALLEQLQIVVSKDDILILQCLDSKVFLEVDSSGGVQCPKRGEDGQVHVQGRITVAKDIMLDILLDQLDPVLISRKDSLIVLVCPTRRAGHRHAGHADPPLVWTSCSSTNVSCRTLTWW